MIWRIHQINPQKRITDQIIEGLKNGDIFILPTDTVYAFVCSLDAPRSINELYRLKQMPTTHRLSLLCRDVGMASHYAQNMPNFVFRAIKQLTPGPYAFILKANRNMDRRGKGKKDEVGVRVVDHPLHKILMEQLDVPLVSTSINPPEASQEEFTTDPEDLDQRYGSRVRAVIDGGICYNAYSTVLDCTSGAFKLLRQGKGEIDKLELTDAQIETV